MELSIRQQDILHGMILGDAYLQKTGSQNARLRLEHSSKQQAYLDWKYSELEHIFQSEPQLLQRVHPTSHRTYEYVRLQSYASAFLGSVRSRFYSEAGKKILPYELNEVLSSPLTIAVWYMDDGYYDTRDKSAHIYVQAFEPLEIQRLLDAFEHCWGIEVKAYCRPVRNACQLNFRSTNRDTLFDLIKPHVITTMRY